MTDREILELLVQKIDGIENRLDNLENDNKSIKEELQEVKQDVNIRLQLFEQEQKRTQITLENVVDRCVQVLGEGYQANYEKIDRMPIDSMNSKINQLEILTKITMNDVELLKQKIG